VLGGDGQDHWSLHCTTLAQKTKDVVRHILNKDPQQYEKPLIEEMEEGKKEEAKKEEKRGDKKEENRQQKGKEKKRRQKSKD